jgi:L-fucose mutarotase/ribose pyranase (RbsD/FucU family)
MGQPIAVVRKPTNRPGVLRFEINRSLTGMGHERYLSLDDASGARPVDELARRLLAQPGVKSVHVYSNVITVETEGNVDVDALEDIIRSLYIHYTEGVAPSFPA